MLQVAVAPWPWFRPCSRKPAWFGAGRGGSGRRSLLVTIVFVFAPMLYGAVSVVGKWHRVPRNYETTGPRLYHPSLANRDESATVKALLQDYSPGKDVWYAPDGITALFLPRRMVIRQADFQPLEQLRREVFRTSVPLRVLVLLPRHFEQNAKGIAIRSSFVQAKRWEKVEIPGCNYIRWAAELIPARQ